MLGLDRGVEGLELLNKGFGFFVGNGDQIVDFFFEKGREFGY